MYQIINGDSIPFIPELAKAVGVSEAIFLQQLHLRLLANNGSLTFDQWQSTAFPFWTTRTIKNIVKRLKDKGIVVTCKPNASSGDHTNTYMINYDALSNLRKEK